MRRSLRFNRRGTPADFVVLGLGNPGADYAHTRHNVGADTVNVLAQRHHAKLRKQKEHTLVDEVRIGELRVALATPLVYMNDSGIAARALVKRFGIEPEQLIVIHDELDLAPGELKVKKGGGLAGHNGLRSIQSHLKTQDFIRVRIGIGKPPSSPQGADHVLSRFSKRDLELAQVALERAADAAELVMSSGVEAAQNKFH